MAVVHLLLLQVILQEKHKIQADISINAYPPWVSRQVFKQAWIWTLLSSIDVAHVPTSDVTVHIKPGQISGLRDRLSLFCQTRTVRHLEPARCQRWWSHSLSSIVLTSPKLRYLPVEVQIHIQLTTEHRFRHQTFKTQAASAVLV